MSEWFLDWFGAAYQDLYGHRTEHEAQLQVEHALTTYQTRCDMLPRQALDIGCGNGRHMRALVRRGVPTIGIDRSLPALQAAREATLASGGPVREQKWELVEADMRVLPVALRSVDLVTAFFTTFGYLSTDDEHVHLLQEWESVLSASGVLMIDYLNPHLVRAQLVPYSEKETPYAWYRETRSISSDGKRVEKQIEVIPKQAGAREMAEIGIEEEVISRKVQRGSFLESVRLYEREELAQMLTRSGLRVLAVHGDFGVHEWSSISPRTIVWAERMAR